MIREKIAADVQRAVRGKFAEKDWAWRLGRLFGRGAEAAGEGYDTVKDTAQRGYDAASDAAYKAKETAREGLQTAVQFPGQAAEYTKDKVRQLGNKAREGYEGAKTIVNDAIAMPGKAVQYVGDKANEIDRAVSRKMDELSSADKQNQAGIWARLTEGWEGRDPDELAAKVNAERARILDEQRRVSELTRGAVTGAPSRASEMFGGLSDYGEAGLDMLGDALPEGVNSTEDLLRHGLDAGISSAEPLADLMRRGYGLGDKVRQSVARGQQAEDERVSKMLRNMIAGAPEAASGMVDQGLVGAGRGLDELESRLGAVGDAAASEMAGQTLSVADLARQIASLGKGTAESVARGRDAAKSNQDIAEAQRDSAMADAAQYDVPEQSLDNIKQMLAGGAQRAGEAWNNADPTAKGLGVAAAGGLGAAGLLKLLRLVAQAKGKKMGPAPV